MEVLRKNQEREKGRKVSCIELVSQDIELTNELGCYPARDRSFPTQQAY